MRKARHLGTRLSFRSTDVIDDALAQAELRFRRNKSEIVRTLLTQGLRTLQLMPPPADASDVSTSNT